MTGADLAEHFKAAMEGRAPSLPRVAGLDVEQRYIIRHHELAALVEAALAKPASSPAGSREEQDLRARIDELLTEREFLTSVISKSHEPHCALWSDEPADCDCRASSPAGGDMARAMETQTEHIARDIREGRFPERSERQPASFVAKDGSLSADWVAMILAEYGRVEDGQIANGPYLAVMIAEAVDRILAALSQSTSAAEPVAWTAAPADIPTDLATRIMALPWRSCEPWTVDEQADRHGELQEMIAAALATPPAPAAVDGQRVKDLEEEVARVKSDRQYIIGFNDGWDEAIKQNLRFPTMLRKMWSGSEVQQWIEDQLATARACLATDKEGA